MQARERRVTFQVAPERAGARVDVAVTAQLGDHSRESVQRLIRGGHVRVNGEAVKPRLLLCAGDTVEVVLPPPTKLEVAAEQRELSILFEDPELLVLDKPRRCVVHPVGARRTGTLVNALLGHCQDLSGIGGVERPGIVHRLDADTSGLMIVAKSDRAHRALADQFRDRSVEKIYLAIAHGPMPQRRGVIDLPIARDPRHRTRMVVRKDGRPSTTEYEVLSTHGRLVLCRVHLLTGRTHQIRVHFAHLGHPLVGDRLYGRGGDRHLIDGVALHAHRLAFAHPVDGRPMRFEIPLPADMRRLLEPAAA